MTKSPDLLTAVGAVSSAIAVHVAGRRWLIWTFGVMRHILVILGAIAVVGGCTLSRDPYVYEIPDGYIGWVRIQFDRSDCPPLSKKDGKFVFSIGNDGRLCTSARLKVGATSDEYYYVGSSRTKLSCTEWRGGGFIWGGSTETITGGTNKSVYEIFFVGTESQYRALNTPHK